MHNMTSDELQAIVRGNLKSRRRELGLTQADVANGVGVTRAFVCQIENGMSRVSLDQLAKFADALRTSPDILLRAEAFSAAVA